MNHERDERLDFLGLFDGHGSNGEHLARFVALNLCDIVLGEHRAQNRDKKDFCQVGWGNIHTSSSNFVWHTKALKSYSQ